MTMQTETGAIFEAPIAHEATLYGQPYATPEYLGESGAPEFQWELQETSHYETETEGFGQELGNQEEEWGELGLGELPELTQEASPYAGYELMEDEAIDPYSGLEAEDEAPAWEDELMEDEGDAFIKFKKVFRSIGRVAKRLAPFAAKALAGMIPGVGAIAAPLAGKLTAALVREGESEAAAFEAQLFGPSAAEAEVGESEAAQEAALTELLAAEAVQAESEAEAESILATTLPITITIMGGRSALRPVMPTLAQANGRLVRVLRRQGPAGRRLLGTVPSIQRAAIGTLRAAARSGRPISGPLAVRAMATATARVLGNPRRLQRAMLRNTVLRQRTAPMHPRRAMTFVPSRVAPPHPRRAPGGPSMRPPRRRVPV